MAKYDLEHNFDLKDIIEKTLQSIEHSKEEVFGIVNHVKQDLKNIKNELTLVRRQTDQIINKVDAYRVKDQMARKRLLRVSKDFDTFTQRDIKKAYEVANEIRLKYHEIKYQEKELIDKRSNLEQQLINTQKILESGENLINKINIAFEYLSKGSFSYKQNSSSKEDRINTAIQMLEARELEKKRISREIHDGPAQSLAGIVFQAEICSNILKKDLDKGLEEIESLKSTVKDTLQEIRNIIYELRPMSLDDIGLVPTIKKLIKNFEKSQNIEVVFSSTEIKRGLDQFVELTIFRLIQEIFNNIKKHSEATHVSVNLSFGTVYMSIKVVDNGVGFNVDETLARVKEEGMNYGLLGLINRVEEILGEIKIESSKNQGTSVYIKIPVSKDVMLDEIKVD